MRRAVHASQSRSWLKSIAGDRNELVSGFGKNVERGKIGFLTVHDDGEALVFLAQQVHHRDLNLVKLDESRAWVL